MALTEYKATIGEAGPQGTVPVRERTAIRTMAANSQEPALLKTGAEALPARAAVKFVVLLGLVSLLADITYEGARSISGPFLSLLGAGAATVGVVAGAGELIGYGLRLVSGYVSDRTGRYWAITIGGYALNLLVVPLLALAGNWQVAAALMIMERVGKALRTPARDAMLSHATAQTGRGWGFGLHEAMDQIGAVTGPLLVSFVLYARGSYRAGFGLLLIPALLALATLVTARFLYPRPRDFELTPPPLEAKGLNKAFWVYLAAVALVAAGFADFPLIAFHLKNSVLVADGQIPLFYATAMGVDALAALIMGRLFDRFGLSMLAMAALAAAFFSPLVFLGGAPLALLGMVLWGLGMGAQESVMRAAVADMAPSDRRGSAYGVFNAGYGIAWFLGSAFMGVIYGRSVWAVVAFSMTAQLVSVPLFVSLRRRSPRRLLD